MAIEKLTDSMPEVIAAKKNRNTKKRKVVEEPIVIESESDDESSDSEVEEEMPKVPAPAPPPPPPPRSTKKSKKSSDVPPKKKRVNNIWLEEEDEKATTKKGFYIEGDQGYICVNPTEHLYVIPFHAGVIIRQYKLSVDDDGVAREKNGKLLLRRHKECWAATDALRPLMDAFEKHLESHPT